jgi:hypothetical protein
MKHLLWAAFFIFFTQYARAQFYKGEKLLGGNFQITNNFSSPVVNGPTGVFFEGDKTFSIAVTPQIISFFADNKAIGLQTGVEYYDSKQGPGTFERNGFSIGLFFKHYKFFYKGLALAYSVGPNYASGIEKSNGSKYKNTFASVQLSPHIVYRFSDHFSLESSLGRAGIGRSTVEDQLNNITAKRTDYFIGMFSGFNLSAYYVFGKKRTGNQ